MTILILLLMVACSGSPPRVAEPRFDVRIIGGEVIGGTGRADPHHFSEGICPVRVNGVPVLRDGRMTGALPGRVLRRKGLRQG